jgi:hypothetical protein
MNASWRFDRLFLFPYCRFTMSVPHSARVITALLASTVFTRDSLPRERILYEYVGSVLPTTFKITRNLNYHNKRYPWVSRRNAFLPVVVGKVHVTSGQTDVQITIRSEWFSAIFAILWYALLIGSIGGFLSQALLGARSDWQALFWPILLLSGLYVWQTLSFNYEVKKAQDFLTRTIHLKHAS